MSHGIDPQRGSGRCMESILRGGLDATWNRSLEEVWTLHGIDPQRGSGRYIESNPGLSVYLRFIFQIYLSIHLERFGVSEIRITDG